MPRKTPVDPMVRQIVGRIHVGESNLAAIRYVVSRLRDGHRTFRQMPRKDRRRLMRQIVQAHQDNFRLYVHVVGGR